MEKESGLSGIERAILRINNLEGKSSGFGASNADAEQPSGQLLWSQDDATDQASSGGNQGTGSGE